MAHCYICDRLIQGKVPVDPRDLKPLPCEECTFEINELIYEQSDEEADINQIESKLDEYNEELTPSKIDLGDT